MTTSTAIHRIGAARPRGAVLALLASLAQAGAAGAGDGRAGDGYGASASDGLVIVEGDIIVRAGDAARPKGATITSRGVSHENERLWPGGIVPVWIDPALERPTVLAIREAIETWNELAGVSIRELGGEAPPAIDHVHFQLGEGCASWVGRRGGAQELWVAPNCTAGSVMHELGHVLGLEHEHTRADRDDWIRIEWRNILPRKRHNFDKAPPGARLLGPYDYASIMHYGADYFSADGDATIVPLAVDADGRPIRLGQRAGPSAGDIEAVARLYGTDLELAARSWPVAAIAPGEAEGPSTSREIELHVTNAGARGARAIEITWPEGWRFDTAVSADGWECGRGPLLAAAPKRTVDVDFAPRCSLERLDPAAVSRLTLRVTPVGTRTGALTLMLAAQTPDDDPADNVVALSIEAVTPPAAASPPVSVSAELDAFDDGKTPGGAGAESPFALDALDALDADDADDKADGESVQGGGSGGSGVDEEIADPSTASDAGASAAGGGAGTGSWWTLGLLGLSGLGRRAIGRRRPAIGKAAAPRRVRTQG